MGQRRDNRSAEDRLAHDSQKAVVTTAQAVAIVIWFEASAWPVPNCTAIR